MGRFENEGAIQRMRQHLARWKTVGNRWIGRVSGVPYRKHIVADPRDPVETKIEIGAL